MGWPWANLGRCLPNHKKTLMSTKASFCGKAFLSEPAKIAFGENKDANSSIKFIYSNSSAPALGGACAMERTPGHWCKHFKFRPSWLFHKGCLSLHSCQTAILPHVGTLKSAHWAFTFQSAFISEKALVVVWGSFKKMTLGLALGEFCATTEKHWCPVSILPIFVGNQVGFKHGLKTHELLPWKRTPKALIQTSWVQAIMTVPQRLSFSAQLVKLQSCHMLAHWTQHTGPSNTLQSAFIWAISFSGSMKFFELKITLGWPWANLGCCLRKCPVSIFALFRRKAFPSLYRVLASHDGRNNESSIGGFNGCSHVGSLNSAYWAFKHPSISIHLSNKLERFYEVLSIENNPWAGLGRILAVACGTTEKHGCLQRHASVGRLSQANLHKSHFAKTRM